MKRRLFYIFLLGFFAFPLTTSASCQEIRFLNGNHFCFDIKKTSSSNFRAQTSSVYMSSSYSCTLRLPNNKSVSLKNCEGDFTYTQNDVGPLLIDVSASTNYSMLTYYDFRNGTFDVNSSDASVFYNDYSPEVYSVSDRRPYTDEWVDVTIRVKRNGSTYKYVGGVNFYVDRYKNGSWSRASSSSYDLDRTYYSFSSSDNWEVKLYDLVRFRDEGEYRLVVELQNWTTAYQSFDTYRSSSSSSSYSSTARSFSLSISPSSPDTYDWIDVTLRVEDYYGDLARNYSKRVNFEVQEYRNGSWRTASSSDYDISRDYYTFSSSDWGRKTFSSLIRFRTSWEYRLKVYENNNSSTSVTKTIDVGYYSSSSSLSYYRSSSSYSYDNFTDAQIKKVRAIYDIWNDVISALKSDYPKLRNSSSWKSRSDRFYSDMDDILRNKRNASYRNWNEFYNGFMDRFNYTVRERG